MCTYIIAGLFDINAWYLILDAISPCSDNSSNKLKAQITCRDIHSQGKNLCASKSFSQKTDLIIQVKIIPHQTRMYGKSEYNLNAFSSQINNNLSVIRYSYFTLMDRPDTFKEIDEWINCCCGNAIHVIPQWLITITSHSLFWVFLTVHSWRDILWLTDQWIN